MASVVIVVRCCLHVGSHNRREEPILTNEVWCRAKTLSTLARSIEGTATYIRAGGTL